jgi:hypothetical protein
MSWILNQRKFLVSLFFLTSSWSFAFPSFRVGGVMGFGGSGITKAVDVTVNDVSYSVNVSRSNGPGVYGFFIEYPLDSLTSIALERFQGFSLSPFSNGVEFTGFSHKWYYMGAMPSMVRSENNNTTLMVKQFVPFAAATVGVAKGVIERNKDLVSAVDATGVYFGGHIGADYQFAPNWILRPDILFGTTMASAVEKSSLSLFGITAGLVYIF